MNPNIKVIDKNVLTTSFSLVGINNLQEICIKGTVSSEYFIAMTKSGQYLLNSDSEYANKYLPYIKVISAFPNRLIGTEKGFYSFIKVFAINTDKITNEQFNQAIDGMISQGKLKNLRHVFDCVCSWEKTRRKVRTNKNFNMKGGER